ncbi:MAG TPA: hypothetical protein DDZ76_09565 [Xanthomonadales bacterium]|nr:hypothetical protein [Xanthomonadales bacterium]
MLTIVEAARWARILGGDVGVGRQHGDWVASVAGLQRNVARSDERLTRSDVESDHRSLHRSGRAGLARLV